MKDIQRWSENYWKEVLTIFEKKIHAKDLSQHASDFLLLFEFCKRQEDGFLECQLT